MYNNISFVNREYEPITYLVEDAYRFKPKGRLAFIQKWLWKFLHKTKALNFHYETRQQLKHVTFNPQNVMEKLLKERSDLKYTYGHNAAVVLIGGADFSELMSLPDIQGLIQFTAPLHVGGPYGYKILHIEIKVIPWMKGMVTMPKGFV